MHSSLAIEMNLQNSCTHFFLLEEAMHRLRHIGGVYTVVIRICTVITLFDEGYDQMEKWLQFLLDQPR